MLSSVAISNYASYKNEQKLGPLKAINFVFGCNGSGKTTISRILANAENPPPGCSVAWDAEGTLQVRVYNKDHVDANFARDKRIPGVFTLGSENIEIKSKDEVAEKKVREIEEKILKYQKALSGVENESQGKVAVRDSERQDLIDYCWSHIKVPNDLSFKNVFSGCRGNKRDFFNECVRQFASRANRTLQVEDKEELEKRGAVLYDKKYNIWKWIRLTRDLRW